MRSLPIAANLLLSSAIGYRLSAWAWDVAMAATQEVPALMLARPAVARSPTTG
jgi:hypothetical protein